MMNFAPSSSLVKSQIEAPSFDPTVVVASLGFSIALAIAIYLDAISPATTPDDLAMLIVFP
jgi:hypothetical protein